MGGDERAKPKVPLDEEWAALARKMLKGADPEERLILENPEVCEGEGSSLEYPYHFQDTIYNSYS